MTITQSSPRNPSSSRFISTAATVRFWAKVDKNGPIPEHRPDLGACWVWMGAPMNTGYGRLSIAGRVIYAYRFLIGAAPAGLEWDHLCRNRACIRPDHLEAVTSRVNTLRGKGFTAQNATKTHCPFGHPYDLFNTRIYKGRRNCRACQRKYDKGRKR